MVWCHHTGFITFAAASQIYIWFVKFEKYQSYLPFFIRMSCILEGLIAEHDHYVSS